MEISIYNQLLTVLFSVVLGAFCGILYDLVKIFRKILVPEYNKKLINKQSKKQYKGISNPIFKRKSKKYKIYSYIITMLFDIFYFIILTPAFCIFTYIMNNGIVRWYIFVFSLIGFVLYKVSIGRISGSIIDCFSFQLRILILYLIKFIKIPLKKLNLKQKINTLKGKFERKNIKNLNESKREVLIQFGK